MRIENLRSEKRGARARVAATVTWEDCDLPTQEVYFETEAEFAQDLSCNPHAFLVGCIVPAMHHGEERVFVDAEVCPELRDGLMTAMSLLRHWYYDPDRALVRIEAKTRSDLPTPRTPERAGFLFSGGIDSLATLRANRLNYPLEHPGSIKDGLLIYGQNIESDNRLETFERAVGSLSEVARDAGITLIPVYTNVRWLDEDSEFFIREFHGAILGATAHAFARRLTRVLIASSETIPTLSPSYGSHPLLDPHYSSCDLRIHHDNLRLTRLEKTRLVAEWDVALQNIKVCGPNYPGANCGRCEKCIRTMLALLALGVLDQTSAFPHDIAEEMVLSGVRIPDPDVKFAYQELMALLAERGHHDLARAVEYRIARFDHERDVCKMGIRRLGLQYLSYHYRARGGWKAMIRRFDRKHLNGSLTRIKKLVFSQS